MKANPYLPDLAAARAVIEEALEPLVAFDADTSELEERAEAIRRQKQQIAEQMRAMREAEAERRDHPGPSTHY